MRNRKPIVPVLGLAASIATWATLAPAHEFWLEPGDFAPKVGQRVPISIRIGQNYKGTSYPYIRQEYIRFVVVDRRGETPVKGIDGDDPALTLAFARDGLTVLAHHSTAEVLTFETWDKFESYLKLEGLEHIKPLHLQQGKPQAKIVESYVRCAKLMLKVGSGRGADRLTGMPLELVAERNPYDLAPGEALPVRLYYEGKPIGGVQITAFSKSHAQERQLVRTDGEGRARINLPTAGPWLLNAVHMFEPGPRDKAHWLSLWASLTFARP
jgi:hypothetical protein